MQTNDINAARQYAAEDFARFLSYAAYLDSHLCPGFHTVLANFLQGKGKVSWINTIKVILGFRLAAKSWIIRQYILWRWLRCPHNQVIIHSSTDDNAKNMARAVLSDLRKNPLMSHLSPRDRTGEYSFNLEGIRPEVGYSITAAGINTSLVGSRCDIYAFDDPEPDTNPEALRNRIISAMQEAKHILHDPGRHCRVMNWPKLPDPEKTQLIVVGQPHCENTVYIPRQDELEDPEGGHPLANAAFIKIPALNSAGQWLWPEMMEKKHFNYRLGRPMTVAEARREYTTPNWLHQMMIDITPLSGLGAVVRVNKIVSVFRTVKHPIMVVDPADGGNCEWGIAIGGMVGNEIHVQYLGGLTGEVYEGDEKDHTLGESVWRRIFDIAEEFKVRKVYLEKNYKAAASACRRYLRKSGRSASVEEYSAKANKLRRICEALEQPFSNGMITVNPEVLTDRHNLKQLQKLRFDVLPVPCDRLDALAALVSELIVEKTVENNPHKPLGSPQKTIQDLGLDRANTGTSPFQRLRGR